MKAATLTPEEELKQMEEYRSVCFKATRELAEELALPLKVNDKGMIEQGVFWLPPLIVPEGGWPVRTKAKIKTVKCICPVCSVGHKRKVTA